ncbi:MAG: topoisomerase IV, partial [Clostridia bacterium]|nr:topoisomerase IV [Clostridia bacterium]
RETAEEKEVVPNLMIGFGIDEVQAEYVAEIKLRHLNREYILKRLEEIENLEKDIAEMESVFSSRSKVKRLIINELEAVIKKYGQERKTKIISASEETELEETEEVDESPVTFFFTKEGYFKKITPQSLRMSGEQKLKEGDEIILTEEATNAHELIFFTNKHQAYKAKASDFADSKASLLGDFVASKLGFDEGETAIYMVATRDYKGNVLFVFDNGRISKVALSAYQTKTNRKKLVGAYCDKFTLHSIIYMEEEGDVLLTSTNNRMLLVSSAALQVKTTRDNSGVAAMTQKKGQRIFSAKKYEKGTLQNEHRYRTRNLPAAGSFKQADTAEQLTI